MAIRSISRKCANPSLASVRQRQRMEPVEPAVKLGPQNRRLTLASRRSNQSAARQRWLGLNLPRQYCHPAHPRCQLILMRATKSAGNGYAKTLRPPKFDRTAQADPKASPTSRRKIGRFCPLPDIGRGFSARGGWTSPPPPSNSLQASDFNHSRASFFLQV